MFHLKSLWKQCAAELQRADLTQQMAKHISDLPENTNIFFADFNHTDSNIHRLMSSPAIMRALKQKGIRELFIEIPYSPELQKIADDLSSGKISRDAFLRTLATAVVFPHSYSLSELKGRCEAVADSIANAHRQGIRICFCDIDTNVNGVKEKEIMNLSTPAETKSLSTNQVRFAKFNALCHQTINERVFAKYGNNLSQTMMNKSFEEILKMNMDIKHIESKTWDDLTRSWTEEDRVIFTKLMTNAQDSARGDDRARANHIKSIALASREGKDNGKRHPIAVFFGGLHMMRDTPTSLTSQFDNVWVCGLFSGTKHIEKLLVSPYMPHREAIKDVQVAVLIQEGQILSGKGLTQKLVCVADKPDAPIKQSVYPKKQIIPAPR